MSMFCENSIGPASVVINVQWDALHDTTHGGETDTVQGADYDNSYLSHRETEKWLTSTAT